MTLRILLAIVAGLVSCKRTDSMPPGSGRTVRVLSDRGLTIEVGRVELDDRGRVRASLVAALDDIPAADAPRPTYTTCLNPIPSSVTLGVLRCESVPMEDLAVTAAGFEQECVTQLVAPKIQAANHLILAGCTAAKLWIYPTDPQLRIIIDPRD